MPEVLGKKNYELYLLHFCVPRDLLLASHVATLNRLFQIFFTYKSKCQLKVTGTLVWSSVEWGKAEVDTGRVRHRYIYFGHTHLGVPKFDHR